MIHNMEKTAIEVHLSVEIEEQIMVAHLTFKNVTSTDLYLDKYTICFDGKFRNNVFEITNGKGKMVDYSGVMMKRLIKPEHFIVLAADEEIKVSLKLNDAYKLVTGKKYVVQFYAFNPGLQGNSSLMEMASNKVEIIY